MAYTAIDDAGIFFNTKLYTGTGASNAQTGVGFQPDFTWIKNRDAADFHVLTDAVRGVTNYLVSDDTDAETTNAESLKTFDSDGFTVGTMNEVNTNTEAFVAWNWKANGAGSSNTDGTINTTATSANTTTGVSISTYTGTGSNATIGHGLGVTPSMVIVKKTSSTGDWTVYHRSLGATKYIFLQLPDAAGTQTSIWNDTEPTTTVFTVGTSSVVNYDGPTYEAYCFAQKQGYSKLGGYTGNLDADGPFVYTGFRPAFVLFKGNNTSDWQLWDNKRDTFNPVEKALHPDIPNTASTDQDIDFLSNGFKIRSDQAHLNGDGVTFIYMAFAESPFVNSEGVPTNAR